jgi:hypothetical protein
MEVDQMEKYVVEIREYAGHTRNGHDRYDLIIQARGETIEAAYVKALGYLKVKYQPQNMAWAVREKMERLFTEMFNRQVS